MADRAEFDGEKSTLHLSGHVVLKESTMTVKGEDLLIDTNKRNGRSEGPLLVDDGVSAVYGESGEFDFAKHTGRLFRSSAGMADWRIHAREAELGANRRLSYRGADFTSCGKVPPDYHFHAQSVSVVPKKRMLARNVLFYLGDVPVFYLPVLYKSLSPVHWFGWKSQPGYDNRNGPYLKNTLTTQYSESMYSKLFADYYTKQGFGYGAELQRHRGEDSRGILYAYSIHETATRDNRARRRRGYVYLP
jgi:LPS-assembly protein